MLFRSPTLYDGCLSLGLNPVAVVLTHGHFDHVGGCGKFYENGVPIYCGEREKNYIFSAENKSISTKVPIPDFEIEKTFEDGEEIMLGRVKFKVMFTPGHTAGSVCYFTEKTVFTGDTLMRLAIGRTDLPTGDEKALLGSVKKLLSLETDYKVLCGHLKDTTIFYERRRCTYFN